MSEELRDLVALWREDANRARELAQEQELGSQEAVSNFATCKEARRCADELEALLTQPEAAGAIAGEGRCAHGIRHPHPCRECEDAALSADPVAAQQPAVVGVVKDDLADFIRRKLTGFAPRTYGSIEKLADDLRMAVGCAALTPAATPVPVGWGVEQKLRDALAYVGVRTDGDATELVSRVENWMRESRVLIDMRGSIIDELKAEQQGPVVDDGCYYIQDTRQFVGNCPMWWCPEGRGYTAHLSRAGRYPEEQAMRIAASRGTDKAWPCRVIDAIASRMVDMQEMPAHPPQDGRKWEEG